MSRFDVNQNMPISQVKKRNRQRNASVMNTPAVMFFLVFSLIKPEGFEQIGILNPVASVLSAGQIITLVYGIWSIKDKPINSFIGLYFYLILLLTISTVINSGIEGLASTAFFFVLQNTRIYTIN